MAPSESTDIGYFREAGRILGYARQVWRMIDRRDRIALATALALMAAISLCNTAFPLLQGRLLDGIQAALGRQETGDQILRLAAIFLAWIAGVFLAREAIQVVRSYIVERTCTRIEKTMSVNVFSHLIKLDLARLTQDKIGAMQGRLTRDVVGFVRFVRLAFLDFLPPLLTGAMALAAAFAMQPLVALAMAGVIPLSLYLTIWQLASQKGIRLKLIASREEMDGTVVEQLSGLDYVRAANTHAHEVERVERVAENRRGMEVRHHFQMSLFTAAKALNQGFFHILLLALSAYLAIQGTMTFGDVLTFSFLFGNLMAPLNEVHRGLDEGHECSLAVADLLSMLGEPLDESFAPANPREPATVAGQPLVDIADLVVEYATPKGALRALDGVSTVVQHGETVGLAGPSGCGKSTWLKSILRLVPPTSGRIMLGGVPIADVSRESIGRLVGYVSQSPFIFAGTIADNIRYGVGAVPDDAVVDAARKACIHDEIVELLGGYGAEVRERGRNLSAGQQQRLALARVFLKNPPVLILDEGTSALDNISERHIQEAIEKARTRHTVILVAHRLSTLRHADRIYVFKAGRVAEVGSFDELHGNGGVFAELVHSATGSSESLGV
jgi:ATP-binding cassette subfamily B protein